MARLSPDPTDRPCRVPPPRRGPSGIPSTRRGRKCHLLLPPQSGVPGGKQSPESHYSACAGRDSTPRQKALLCPCPLRPPLQGHAGRQPPPLLWASARLPPTETRAPSVAGGHRHLRCFREGTWCVSPPPPPGPRRAGDRSLPQLPPPANASQARPVLRLTRRSQRVLEALPAPPGRGGRPGVGSPRRPRGRDNGRADPAWVSDRGELLPRDHGRLAACAVVSVA